MKLVIAGASGFVGTELVRQSLRRSDISTIVALARKPVTVPEDIGSDADPSKLHSVVIDDYGTFPENVRKELAQADACIWTVAITPTKSRDLPWDLVKEVCQHHTLVGLKALYESRGISSTAKASRFMYVSGIASERDQSKTPPVLAEYALMRGETENQVLAFAEKHKDHVEACVSKPGLITSPSRVEETNAAMKRAAEFGVTLPSIDVTDLSNAMLDQVVNGFTKEPLLNEDLVQLGKK